MTHTDFIKLLEKMVAAEGSQRALARKLSISASYLGDVLIGRRDPGLSILEPLGFIREVRIVKKITFKRTKESKP